MEKFNYGGRTQEQIDIVNQKKEREKMLDEILWRPVKIALIAGVGMVAGKFGSSIKSLNDARREIEESGVYGVKEGVYDILKTGEDSITFRDSDGDIKTISVGKISDVDQDKLSKIEGGKLKAWIDQGSIKVIVVEE